MRLDFIPLDRLSVSKANMRYGTKPPDVADILPTVRRRGVLQPVVVQPADAPGRFEIVAGRRRFHAATIVAGEASAEDKDAPPATLPCAILDASDDAAAVEASLIENIARRDADEVTQWQTFTRLVKEGRDIADIAATFGLPELAVRRVLALGNLLPRIRALYARDEIDRASIRHLTLASKRQQQAWLALADDDAADLPTGARLKAWLLGGQSIAVRHALFDVAASGLVTVADLFGEDQYFADPAAFWTAQNAALAARREACLAAGWRDAVIVPPTEHFAAWDYEKRAKRKGGRVYFDVRTTGEVVTHEGYIGRAEAARLARGDVAEPPARPPRPEITAAMQTYVDLHRHAAVRAALAQHPGVALRLAVAQLVVGAPLVQATPHRADARHEATRDSIADSVAEREVATYRHAVLALIDRDPDRPTVTGGNGDAYALVCLFRRLLALDDAQVMALLAVVAGELLASGTAAVEAVGAHLGVDMTQYWRADDAFFALIRDREVLTGLLGEVAGDSVAAANAKEKLRTMTAILRDHLDGTNGRTAVASWVPRWMRFPASAYTQRGGVGSVAASALVAAAASADETVTSAENGGRTARGNDMPLPDATPIAA